MNFLLGMLLVLLQVQPETARFTVLVDGRAVGTEEFSISATGDGFVARGRTRIQIDGETIDAQSRMELDRGLNPRSYEYTSGDQGVRVRIGTGVTEVEYTVEGERTSYDIRFPEDGMIIDDNFFHHYALLLYRAGGEAATFPVLVPQQLTLGAMDVAPAGSGIYTLTTENLELHATTDRDGRLLRLVLVGANVVIER